MHEISDNGKRENIELRLRHIAGRLKKKYPQEKSAAKEGGFVSRVLFCFFSLHEEMS